jgi:hypothetical protein
MTRDCLLVLTLLLLPFAFTFAQTNISGTIVSNKTLLKVESPYLVNSTITVPQGITLSIEPGVELRFAADVRLEVRGSLTAVGTLTDSIKFTSQSAFEWEAIWVRNDLNGSATFDYCGFSNANTAIYEYCCGAGIVSVNHSRFTNNQDGMAGYSGHETSIKNSVFAYNVEGVANADKKIENCVFHHNKNGLSETDRVSVYNSTFKNHTQAALKGRRGTVSFCTITDNEIGIEAMYEGFTVSNSTISNNVKGMTLGSYTNSFNPIQNNQICNNSQLNVENNSSVNVNLFTNCFCTSDSTTIENKLIDGLDNGSSGLINFSVYSDDCNAFVKNVDKSLPQNIYFKKINSPILITQNKTVFSNQNLIIEPGVEIHLSADVQLEVRGKLTAVGTPTDSIKFISPGAGEWLRIWVRNDQNASATFDYCRFSNANTAINESCCGAGIVSVNHSRFTNNQDGMAGYSGHETSVKNSVFAYNVAGVANADKKIENCVFHHNKNGLSETDRVSVYNSTFKNHTQAALKGRRGTVSFCTITNNEIGIEAMYEGFTVSNSIISNNVKGMTLGSYTNTFSPIQNNQICNNSQFNVENTSSVDVNLLTNCFCTSDYATIENKIIDGLDNGTSGLINFSVYSDDCTVLLKNVVMTPAPSVLTKAGSPYVFLDNLIIYPGKTMTIEPGVTLKFASGKKIEVRGNLTAVGTSTDSINFISQGAFEWEAILVRNDLNASATFDYCRFSNANTAINETCCGSGIVSVNHSRFANNQTGMGGNSGHETSVKNSVFAYNVAGVTHADKKIENSIFHHNDYGLLDTKGVSVYNSTFKNHTQAALKGGRGTVSFCTITNNAIGISAFFEGFTVSNSTVSNNVKGMILGNYGNLVGAVQNNQICNNSQFNVANASSVNVNLFTNCFCTSDSTAIENKLIDGMDNPEFGLIDYSIYNACCKDEYFQIKKITKQKETLKNTTLEILGYSVQEILEDAQIVLTKQDLKLTNPDLLSNECYTLKIGQGTNYQLNNNNTIVPLKNFAGTLTVPLIFSDGVATGNYEWKLKVLPVNDRPVIKSYNKALTVGFKPIEFLIQDFTVEDPDNSVDDLTITLNSTNQYDVLKQTITPKSFAPPFKVYLTISDLKEASEIFEIGAEIDRVTNLDDDMPFVVWPKIFSDRLNVGFPSELYDKKTRVELLNEVGQTVWVVESTDHEVVIEGLDIYSGLYLLRIRSQDFEKTVRVIKQ